MAGISDPELNVFLPWTAQLPFSWHTTVIRCQRIRRCMVPAFQCWHSISCNKGSNFRLMENSCWLSSCGILWTKVQNQIIWGPWQSYKVFTLNGRLHHSFLMAIDVASGESPSYQFNPGDLASLSTFAPVYVCTMSFLDSQLPSHLSSIAQHYSGSLSWKCCHWSITPAEKAAPQRAAWQRSTPWPPVDQFSQSVVLCSQGSPGKCDPKDGKEQSWALSQAARSAAGWVSRKPSSPSQGSGLSLQLPWPC